MTGRVVALAALTAVAGGLVQGSASPPAALFFWPAAAAVAVAPFAWRDARATWLVTALSVVGFVFCQVAVAAQPTGLTFARGVETTHLAAALRHWTGWGVAAAGAALLVAVARVSLAAAGTDGAGR